MKNLENEYKNRFNAQEMPVDKTDSDELWAAVSAELDAATPNRKPRFGALWYWMVPCFLLLLFIGVWAFYCVYCTISSLPQAGTGDVLMEADGATTVARPNTATKNSKPFEAAAQASEKSASILTHPSGSHKKSPAIEYLSTNTPNESAGRAKNRRKSAQQSAQSIGAIKISKGVAIPAPSNPNIPVTVLEVSDNTVVLPAHVANAPIQVLEPLAMLSFQPLKTVLNLTEQPILPLYIVPDNPKKRPSIGWQVAAESGANVAVFRFASADQKDLAAKKNATELSRLGNSTALRASLLWQQRWAFATGLEFHQYRSVFSYEQQETIKVLKTNQLLRTLVNTVNGDTLRKIFGDTLINAQSTRTVWHNNTFRQMGIPLEVGLQKYTGKWLVGGGIGAVFALTIGQSGKALDDKTQIVSFETKDAVAPFAKIGIGFRASPVLGYRMGNHWVLTLRPQWTWQRNTGLSNADLRMNAYVFNANLGLQYTIR